MRGARCADDTGWQVTVDQVGLPTIPADPTALAPTFLRSPAPKCPLPTHTPRAHRPPAQYFFGEVYYVVDTVVDQLLKDPNRHFIYVEIGFFSRWWDEQPDYRRNQTRELVKNGQLEFINGGWCMHDEASPFYVEMVDQTTRGHQFLIKNFGVDARPRGTWQIDPFGHSNTEAWLLGAESGMESLFWGRTDYQDMKLRTSWEGHANNQWPQWIWQGSQSLGDSAQVLAGQLGSGGYGTHIGWDRDGGAVQDNPERHDYNLDQMVDQFISAAIQQQNITKTNHQMWACGSDFQYQNADHWFHNLDKIIHYVNLNASMGGPVKAFYSTPSHYTDSVKQATKAKGMKWEVRTDDVFPLGDAPHHYWSGYFTSRPALKRQVRFATNFLQAARQLEVVTGITAKEVDLATVRPSPPVGDSWSDSMEGAIGVATHHDGMSGTERQSVANDYSQRISESHFEVEAGVAKAFQRILGSKAPFGHCNCNTAGNCLNISQCAYTTGIGEFTVAAWNPNGQPSSSYLRIPVSGAGWKVTDAHGAAVPSQTMALDKRTLQLPLLYLNKYKMNASQVAAAEAALENRATHVLTFPAAVPPIGFATFKATKSAAAAAAAVDRPLSAAEPTSITNGIYTVTVDPGTGLVSSIKNLVSGVTTPLSLEWGYYNSSTGGCTYALNGTKLGCDKQASGAYMFRPINQTTRDVCTGKPVTTVTVGEVVSEIKQTLSEYASHTVRLTKGSKFVEVEWTAGPIPTGMHPLPPKPAPGGCQGWKQTMNCDAHGPADPTNNKPCNATLGTKGESGYCLCAHGVKVYGSGCGGPAGVKNCNEACSRPIPQFSPMMGKEVVLKVGTNLQSKGTFYTDSNGREMVRRQRFARGPSYPPLVDNEPVAENYYPVNSMISVDDGRNELAVVTDVSMGGSSMVDGQVELMVHRRVQKDDSRGVQEPLNETMCGCNDIGAAPGAMGAHGHEGDGGCDCQGLTMRGSAYLVFDGVAAAHEARRDLIETLNFPPTLAFTKEAVAGKAVSYTDEAVPANVKLMTITSNYAAWNDGAVLVRFAHKYQVDEHPTLAKPATVDLAAIFGKSPLKLVSAEEMTVTANQPRATIEARNAAFKWPTEDRTGGRMHKSDNVSPRLPFDAKGNTFTIRPMEVRTFLVKFE